MEYKQADSCRNQELPRARFDPGFCGVLFQCIAGTDACKQEEHRHKPWIQDIHYNILILRVFWISAEASDAAKNTLVVEKVDDVIQQDQQYSHPAKVVYPVLSHFVSPSIVWSIAA